MIEYSYLRNNKAKSLQDLHSKDFFLFGELQEEVFENATVLPLKKLPGDALLWGRGGLLDSKGEYIDNTGIRGFVGDKYDYSCPLTRNETIVYCGYLRFEWGHLIVDCSNRLYYALQHYENVDKIVYFVEEHGNCELSGNYKEFFELLGIIDKVLILNRPTTFLKVIVPQKAYDRHEKYCYPEFLQVFDTVRQNAYQIHKGEKPTYSKVFMTRSKLISSQKLEFGMDMLDNLFEKNGYKIISPERMRLSELILILDHAEEVACCSGTLPHNMIFSNSKARLTILERYCLNNDIQVDINRIKKLNVTYVDANMSIYPVEISYGPFIFTFNRWLMRYCEENHLAFPDTEYLSQRYKRTLYRKYKKKYSQEFYERLYMPKWIWRYADLIGEAYNESDEYFREYLYGIKLYSLSQLLSVRMIKTTIKSVIRKILHTVNRE